VLAFERCERCAAAVARVDVNYKETTRSTGRNSDVRARTPRANDSFVARRVEKAVRTGGMLARVFTSDAKLTVAGCILDAPTWRDNSMTRKHEPPATRVFESF